MKIKKKEDKILLDLWNQIVFIKAKHQCEICGKNWGRLNGHHIFSSRKKSTRYDTRNGVCLCFQHHRGGKNSAHQAPYWFERWLIGKIGKEAFEILYNRSQMIVKYLDFETIKECLEKELSDLTRQQG